MAPKLKKQPSSASRRDSKHCSITNRMAENRFSAISQSKINHSISVHFIKDIDLSMFSAHACQPFFLLQL
jgi:hypothetical protein